MNRKYISLSLPRKNEDKPLLRQLRGVENSPVFIMGLHRSGTTTLYQTLVDLLPVSGLTVYHIVYYNNLLNAHMSGTTREYQEKLDTFFKQRGLTTRIIDSVPLTHQTVEEYGWLLKQHTGYFKLGPKTATFFKELNQKLHYLDPKVKVILFKNPWDTGQAFEILKLYPHAKFIYIKRDPLAILNSQFRNTIHYGRDDDPYLDLLIRDIFKARMLTGFLRKLYRTIGECRFKWFVIRMLKNATIAELNKYETVLQQLPPTSFVEISYESYIKDPQHILKTIADFLNLPITGDLSSIKAKPRKQTFFPEVQRHKASFLSKL